MRGRRRKLTYIPFLLHPYSFKLFQRGEIKGELVGASEEKLTDLVDKALALAVTDGDEKKA